MSGTTSDLGEAMSTVSNESGRLVRELGASRRAAPAGPHARVRAGQRLRFPG